MILIPAGLFILILTIGYYSFKTSIQTSTISTMKRVVEDHRHMIDSFLSERKADLEFILYSYVYEYLADPEKLYNVFAQLQKKSNAFVDLGLFNEEGIHVAYQGPYKLVGRNYGQEDWFKEVLKTGYYISDVFLGYRRVPHFIISLRREDGGNVWVIRATIDTYMFNDLVKKVRIGKTGEAYILNSEGLLQTERRSGGTLMQKHPDTIRYSSLNSGIETFIKKDERGDEYLYATTWLRDKKWFLVVRQEKADAFKALRSATYLIVLISILGGSAIIGVASYLTNRIVKRMERMDAEKDALGQQLIRAGRLAELGEMAAGFAHEINNPLQIIKNEQALMEVILSDLKDAGELKQSESLAELEDSIAQINVQISRCAQITQAILKFGRKSEPILQNLPLDVFIPEVTAMVKKNASVHGITITQEIAEDLPPIHGDATQLQQVLLNLFNNAIDAIVEKHGSLGGEVIISAGQKENGNVEISVKDNGSGISSENLKKIFAPFFTTKPVGKGTGLGLSVCYGIVESMGGVMEVSSEKGVGTMFMIRLPAAA
jgi:two-component system NtrC family sensor kinase